MSFLRIKTLEDFNYSFKIFFSEYSFFTIKIIVMTLLLSIVELVSMTMILPLMSLGLENQDLNPLLEFLKSLFLEFGLNYTFNTIFMVFIFFYLLKIFDTLEGNKYKI